MAVLATCDSGQTLVVELLDATVDGGTREARTFATLEFACPIASIKPAVVFRVSGDVARIGQPVQVLIKGTVEGNVRLMLQTTNTATR